MYGGGIGTLTVSAKNAADGEDAAWVPVWTKEGGQGDSWQAATVYSASGSYYQVMATRGGGIRGDIAVDNLNVMWCSPAPSGAVASSVWSGAAYDASKAIDEDVTSMWHSVDGLPQWLQLTLSSSQAICGYAITARTDDYYSSMDSPKAWLFEAWDGSSWNTVSTQSEISPWAGSETKTFTHSATQAEMFRIYVTEVGGRASKDFTVIAEFSIHGCPDITAAPTPSPTVSPTAPPAAQPTLAPTYVGELPICNFTAGFCDWTQDGDDNFDWTLTSEGTPTSNTGPSTGSGHGGGAFIHIEANDQTEGAYAAITSSTTGCGLYVDYHMYGGGIGTLTVSAKNAADGEDAAWVPVWTKEGGQGNSWQAATVYSASGSYYQVMATRGAGIRGDIAVDNLNVMWCTDVPTASPTNVGDTHSPTVSPTSPPTDVPTDAPTYVPPTAAPTMNPPSNWNQLKSTCENSACNTANGGCTIILSDDFVMGSFTGEIDFSGKTITIWGQGKVLDALGEGRFFRGEGANSFLELHDAVLQNGNANNVSR
jgi:hypothetical protein